MSSVHWLTFSTPGQPPSGGINLTQVMSWGAGLTEKGEPCVTLCFAVMAQDLAKGPAMQPWAMRLTGEERQQFLAAVVGPTA